jgi:hypothetical protein
MFRERGYEDGPLARLKRPSSRIDLDPLNPFEPQPSICPSFVHIAEPAILPAPKICRPYKARHRPFIESNTTETKAAKQSQGHRGQFTMARQFKRSRHTAPTVVEVKERLREARKLIVQKH